MFRDVLDRASNANFLGEPTILPGVPRRFVAARLTVVKAGDRRVALAVDGEGNKMDVRGVKMS